LLVRVTVSAAAAVGYESEAANSAAYTNFFIVSFPPSRNLPGCEYDRFDQTLGKLAAGFSIRDFQAENVRKKPVQRSGRRSARFGKSAFRQP